MPGTPTTPITPPTAGPGAPTVPTAETGTPIAPALPTPDPTATANVIVLPVITMPVDGQSYLQTAVPFIGGTAQPGATVNVTVTAGDGSISTVCDATAAADGTWYCSYDFDTLGTYVLIANAYDGTSAAPRGSVPVTIIIAESVAPAATPTVVSTPTGVSTPASTPTHASAPGQTPTGVLAPAVPPTGASTPAATSSGAGTAAQTPTGVSTPAQTPTGLPIPAQTPTGVSTSAPTGSVPAAPVTSVESGTPGPSGVETAAAGVSKPTIDLSSMTLSPGQSVVFGGRNWVPGEQVTITVHSDPIQFPPVTVNPDGTLPAMTVTLPATFEAGTHTLTAVGTQSGTVTMTFQVLAAGAVPAGSAPVGSVPGATSGQLVSASTGGQAAGAPGLGWLAGAAFVAMGLAVTVVRRCRA